MVPWKAGFVHYLDVASSLSVRRLNPFKSLIHGIEIHELALLLGQHVRASLASYRTGPSTAHMGELPGLCPTLNKHALPLRVIRTTNMMALPRHSCTHSSSGLLAMAKLVWDLRWTQRESWLPNTRLAGLVDVFVE